MQYCTVYTLFRLSAAMLRCCRCYYYTLLVLFTWPIFPESIIKLKGSVKEPNKFHNYETEKITCKASDAAEYIELFGSSTRDCHARRI